MTPGGATGGGSIDPRRERISNRPWSVTMALGPEEEGCLRVTLVTYPVPLRMHTPFCFFLENVIRLSLTSHPELISMACALSVFGLSLVMIIGGLGLFLDPAGLPRGLRIGSTSAGGPVRGTAVGIFEGMSSPLESIPGFWWLWSLMPFDSTEWIVMSMLPAMQMILYCYRVLQRKKLVIWRSLMLGGLSTEIMG